MITEEVHALALQLWNYHHMNHTLKKADCILVLGSHDLRVAERAAQLYLQEWAPLLIFSGGLGRLTKDIWTGTEAERFAAVALSMGVPHKAILVENRSTNTGENIKFTQKLLEEKGLSCKSFIIVQKPYMERRLYATFMKNWPGKELILTSPQVSFDEYATADIPVENFINIMVGDLQRIKEYPNRGFQEYQHIPAEVWNAYERLVELGFDQQMIK
jgi:uncharacterized SAM-binding protein YcdF (DUF218 family)